MARKTTVDVGKVMQMLREGKTTKEVAGSFGVSRQAIDLHRRRFIADGQLEEKRATRVSALSYVFKTGNSSSSESGSGGYDAHHGKPSAGSERFDVDPSGNNSPPSSRLKSNQAVSMDSLIELIIEAFDSLKRAPGLEAELEKCRRDYRKALEKTEALEAALIHRTEQEARLRLVLPPDGNK